MNSFRLRIILVSFAMLVPLLLVAKGPTVAELSRKLEELHAYPDLIVFNAKIYTMDPALRRVQAMAVKNHRILALGTNAEIRFLAGPKTKLIDAKGYTILPGLINSHTHPNLWSFEAWFGAHGDWAVKRYHDPELRIVPALGNNQTEILRSIERVVREREKELGPGKWILVKVFGGKTMSESRKIASPLFATSGVPAPINVKYLDTLAPNNPLILFATEAIGPTASNTMAQERMRKLLGYAATGIFARTVVPYEVLLHHKWNDAADLLRHEILTCLSTQGVTTFGDRFDRSPSVIKEYNLLYQRGEMPIRYGYYSEGGANTTQKYDNPAYNHIIIRLLNQEEGDFRGIGNDYMWDAGVANEAWEGGIRCTKARPLPKSASRAVSESVGAQGRLPDCANPINYDKQVGYESVKAGLDNGLRIGFMHGYTDGTYDALFHMLDQEVAEHKLTVAQIRALRISTEHNPMIRPDQVAEFAKYGIRPGFNGYQIQGDIKGGAFLKNYGERYLNWMVPVKSLMDAGVHVVFNTDACLCKNIPYYYKDMDYPKAWDGNIWAFMEFFATRYMPSNGMTYEKNQGLDKVSLLKAATIWGAEQLMNEKNIGSLEVGKLADFVVINKDYFVIPKNQIHTIKPLLTVLGGKTTYRSAAF